MSLSFIDAFGFAGAFSLGATQAGWELVGKREGGGGFGVANMMANRHLLGERWQPQVAPPEQWEPMTVDAVFGNPPCSSFSVMSSSHYRGMDGPANSCMWALIDYAARCGPPLAVAFESVGQAYTQGRPLMVGLRDRMEAHTGMRYGLTHVLHNALSVGGGALRKRYFCVLHRIPFGANCDPVKRVPMLRDVIGDLEGLGSTWEPQTVRRPASWWAQDKRRADGLVCGHVGKESTHSRRLRELLSTVPWEEGEGTKNVLRRYHRETGTLPEGIWRQQLERLLGKDFHQGFQQTTRWRYDRVARVLTGNALRQGVHPVEPRLFTHREAARIMGYPDDWLIRPLKPVRGLEATWGKQLPVDCGRWIAKWVKRAIEGTATEADWATGEVMGDREVTLRLGDGYRAVCKER